MPRESSAGCAVRAWVFPASPLRLLGPDGHEVMHLVEHPADRRIVRYHDFSLVVAQPECPQGALVDLGVPDAGFDLLHDELGTGSLTCRLLPPSTARHRLLLGLRRPARLARPGRPCLTGHARPPG